MRHISAMCFGENDAGMASGEDGDILGILPIVVLFALLILLSVCQPTILVTLLHEAALTL